MDCQLILIKLNKSFYIIYFHSFTLIKMDLAKGAVEYLLHPEIYARHIPTPEELDYINNHPIVNDPPTDLSKYGGGELFSE